MRPCSLVASVRDSSSIGSVSTISASSALDVRDAITLRICVRDDWRIVVVSKDITLLCFLTAGCESSDMVIGNWAQLTCKPMRIGCNFWFHATKISLVCFFWGISVRQSLGDELVYRLGVI